MLAPTMFSPRFREWNLPWMYISLTHFPILYIEIDTTRQETIFKSSKIPKHSSLSTLFHISTPFPWQKPVNRSLIPSEAGGSGQDRSKNV